MTNRTRATKIDKKIFYLSLCKNGNLIWLQVEDTRYKSLYITIFFHSLSLSHTHTNKHTLPRIIIHTHTHTIRPDLNSDAQHPSSRCMLFSLIFQKDLHYTQLSSPEHRLSPNPPPVHWLLQQQQPALFHSPSACPLHTQTHTHL